ncbi:MAG: alkaline phosphatase [Alteromonadaceae bacterium]|nr:alkaline phosphatase [Alteromonadaceae bacterium]
MTFSRRHFIKTGLATGLISPFYRPAFALPNSALFDCGVASGDPTHDAVIIWTHTTKPVTLTWQVAEDVAFTRIVKQGQGRTFDEADCTFKVDVTGLTPGSIYYYRFSSGSEQSEPGRTKTLPEGNLDTLSIAVASCSNYPFGYFNAYHHIASDSDIDFVVHLGDYIYEYGQSGWGAESGRQLNRQHLPAHEIVSLADYRQRHRQYKTDSGSRLMHATHPLIPTWDDHESANNPYMNGAQNHQSHEGSWTARRAASIQAYYEWMPLREPGPQVNKAQLWRHFSFGNLATLTTLETRHTGRSLQIDYGEHLKQLNTEQSLRHFIETVLGDPSRTMISVAMEQFLEAQLAASVKHAKWRLIGNQIPIARTHVPDVTDLTLPTSLADNDPVAAHFAYFMALGKLDLTIYLDTWDGYPVAREKFYQLCQSVDATDLIVLTGDSHAFWANQLYAGDGDAMGVELGTAGITSPGDFESLGPELATELDLRVASHNREIMWTDCQHRGYVKVSLQPEQATVKFIAVSNVNSEHYTAKTLRQYRITKQGRSLSMTRA